MKFLKAWVISFIAIFVLSVLWYGLIVSGFNAEQFSEVLRGPEDFSMVLITIGYILLALLLAYIYPKGYRDGRGTPMAQGFRFGLLMGLLWALPTAFIESGSYQFPLPARILDTAYHIVEFCVAGVIIGWAYGESPQELFTGD